MSARNGDKSRFHRLRKAKIRRRLRTELLQSLVTTKQELPAAPAKESAGSEPSATEAKDAHPHIGPLAAAAKTLGSTLGAIVAKAGPSHKDADHEAQPTE